MATQPSLFYFQPILSPILCDRSFCIFSKRVLLLRGVSSFIYSFWWRMVFWWWSTSSWWSPWMVVWFVYNISTTTVVHVLNKLACSKYDLRKTPLEKKLLFFLHNLLLLEERKIYVCLYCTHKSCSPSLTLAAFASWRKKCMKYFLPKKSKVQKCWTQEEKNISCGNNNYNNKW